MRINRRIEITAFRRRVTIVSGEFEAYVDEDGSVQPAQESSLKTISPESDEGMILLVEAVSILQEARRRIRERLSEDGS